MKTRANAVKYSDMPPRYHYWKWRVLLVFAFFYLFAYFGRFNFWPISPLVKDDLDFTYIQIGLVNVCLLWGFGLGDILHGRASEYYGFRVWIVFGAITTTVFNLIASLGTSIWTIAVPYGIAGFCNAACWAPGISMIAQWWPRKDRGLALGIVGTASGGSMLLMWWVVGYVGIEFGWRAAFRYPPIIVLILGVVLYFLVRDRPAHVDMDEYIEEDPVSSTPEISVPVRSTKLGPYKLLLKDPKFHLASHVKGLENVVKYGLTTWIPLYYFEVGKHSIESTVLLTAILPMGYLIAPLISGLISDRLLNSNRRPMVITSCVISAGVLFLVAIVPPYSSYIGALLLLLGGLSIGLSPMSTLAVDIAGRDMAATSSGLLDAHGYAYAGLQALLFSIILDMTGSPWNIVFICMALVRVLSVVMIYKVRV
ncbi:MAG: hypothetical protein CL886_04005 [Dehalococcoidia bacterium]|nr:hypothetical protein [Dehalococcoidia bacterium]